MLPSLCHASLGTPGNVWGVYSLKEELDSLLAKPEGVEDKIGCDSCGVLVSQGSVTKQHTLGALRPQTCVLSQSEARSLKARCGQGRFLLEALLASGVPSSPRHSVACRRITPVFACVITGLSPLCVCVHSSLF